MGVEGKSEISWKWKAYLSNPINYTVLAAPVTSFSHVPLSDLWNFVIGEGRVTEVKLKHETVKHADCMWFAEIIKLSGYMAKVRFVGFTPEAEQQFENIQQWVHIKNLYQIGHCANSHNSQLLPPIFVKDLQVPELTAQAFQYLVGKLTLCPIYEILLKYNPLPKFKPGQRVEVLRKEKGVYKMSMAYVKKTVDRRVQFAHFDAIVPREFQWCHENWEFIKPSGWCAAVGLSVDATDSYKPTPLSDEYFLTDPRVVEYMNNKIDIDANMMFEIVNPLSEGEIVTGKVTKVLNYGYFEYSITAELSDEEKKMIGVKVQFFVHVTSPIIFPCGFCEEHGLPLIQPSDAPLLTAFSWPEYLKTTGLIPLPLQKYQELAKKRKFNQNFKVGMKLEAIDCQISDMTCPGTIQQIVEPFMMKIAYDGWGEDFDAWKACTSTEIFPVGWCELTNKVLEPPFEQEKITDQIEAQEIVIPKQNSGKSNSKKTKKAVRGKSKPKSPSKGEGTSPEPKLKQRKSRRKLTNENVEEIELVTEASAGRVVGRVTRSRVKKEMIAAALSNHDMVGNVSTVPSVVVTKAPLIK